MIHTVCGVRTSHLQAGFVSLMNNSHVYAVFSYVIIGCNSSAAVGASWMVEGQGSELCLKVKLVTEVVNGDMEFSV